MIGVELVDLFRTVVTVLAAVSAVVNFLLVPALIRLHRARGLPSVGTVYAFVAGSTNCVSIYFRVRDGFANSDWTVGDFTALVPTVGFLVAGLWAWRTLGRLAALEHVNSYIKRAD